MDLATLGGLGAPKRSTHEILDLYRILFGEGTGESG